MEAAIKSILEKPRIIGDLHESCFRSYHILEQVLLMVERGDSKESIFEVVEYLREVEDKKEDKKTCPFCIGVGRKFIRNNKWQICPVCKGERVV